MHICHARRGGIRRAAPAGRRRPRRIIGEIHRASQRVPDQVTVGIVTAVTLAGAVGSADTGKSITLMLFLIGGVAEAVERHRAGGEQQTVGVIVAKLLISPLVGVGYAWCSGMGLGAFLGAPPQ